MSTTVKPLESRLSRLRCGQCMRFERPRQLCLRAERGSLWITVDGELADIELAPGQSRVFDGGAMVLVSSLGSDAVLSATPLQRTAGRGGRSRRLLAWLGWAPQHASLVA